MNRRAARRGFTYIELVASLAISAILMLALASVIIISSKAVPTGTEQAHKEAEINEALSVMTEDFESAVAMSFASTRSVRLMTPDRDGDGNRERITYEIGDPGDPLTRQFNSDDPRILIAVVDSCTASVELNSDGKTSAIKLVFSLPEITNPSQTLYIQMFNLPGAR